MGNALALLLCVFLLSGCLETIGIIKLVGDVGSYISTQKSLTDHAISEIKDEDCAIHRALTEGYICKSDEEMVQETPDDES